MCEKRRLAYKRHVSENASLPSKVYLNHVVALAGNLFSQYWMPLEEFQESLSVLQASGDGHKMDPWLTRVLITIKFLVMNAVISYLQGWVIKFFPFLTIIRDMEYQRVAQKQVFVPKTGGYALEVEEIFPST